MSLLINLFSSDNPNWNFEADNIAATGSECPMNNRLNTRVDLEYIELILVEISLTLLQRTRSFLTILGEYVVACGDAIDPNPWNLNSIDIRLNIGGECIN